MENTFSNSSCKLVRPLTASIGASFQKLTSFQSFEVPFIHEVNPPLQNGWNAESEKKYFVLFLVDYLKVPVKTNGHTVRISTYLYVQQFPQALFYVPPRTTRLSNRLITPPDKQFTHRPRTFKLSKLQRFYKSGVWVIRQLKQPVLSRSGCFSCRKGF